MAIETKHKLLLFPKMGKLILLSSVIAILIVGFRAVQLFRYIFKENIRKDYVLFVPDGTSFDELCNTLDTAAVLQDMKAFRWVARIKKIPEMIKPGRYHFRKGMNTNEVGNILRAGIQEPVKLVINSIRTKEDLAGVVSTYLMTDSLSILGLFEPEVIEKYGFSPETFPAMFIPNTYEFYWTTSAGEFAERMKKEYDRFWNEERLQKAQVINLSPVEVATLASILQEETNKKGEMARIAGVYINRLQKGMPLQADPTVKFATGDVTLRRILNRHLEIDSPYNTYLYPGLPPGPINFPEITSIEAVLNYEKHNLLYFCAREDFSGYHNFARTNAEHERNAARYHAALENFRNSEPTVQNP